MTNTVSPSVFSSVERDLSHVSFVLVTFPPVPSLGLPFCSHGKISAPFTLEPLTVSPTTLLHAVVSRHPGYILPPALRDCDVHLVYGCPVLTPCLSCQLLPSPCGSPFLPQSFLVLDFSPFLPICFLAPTHTSFPEFLIPKLVELSQETQCLPLHKNPHSFMRFQTAHQCSQSMCPPHPHLHHLSPLHKR